MDEIQYAEKCNDNHMQARTVLAKLFKRNRFSLAEQFQSFHDLRGTLFN